MPRNKIAFVNSILICQLAGVLGSVFTFNATASWYTTLDKPSFTPPGWLFGPVWVTLYFLMGIALYLIWERRKRNGAANGAVALFLLHLVVNSLWSFLFFGLRSPIAGLIDIILLWLLIIVVIRKFLTVYRPAGYLLIPYFIWVSYATILNIAIVLLN